MAKQITVKDETAGGDDPKLIAKVDQMMDPSIDLQPVTETEPAEPVDSAESNESDLPPLDIFADMPSAPVIKGSKEKEEKEVKIDPPSEEIAPEPPSEKPGTHETVSEDKVKVEVKLKAPEEYDDPKTSEAIEEIIAEERGATEAKAERPQKVTSKSRKHGHRFFWSIIFIICLIAVGIGLYLAYPSWFGPLSKIHWNSIRRHI